MIPPQGGHWRTERPEPSNRGERFDPRRQAYVEVKVLDVRPGNANGDGTVIIWKEV